MIYVVEIDFSDAGHEAEWNAWYMTHLPKMVQVPGILTAQRFKAANRTSHAYLALYTAEASEVFLSDAYRDNGGAGVASLRWKAFITRRRTLYAGVERMPEVSPDGRVLLTGAAPTFDASNVLFGDLHRIALDEAMPERRIAVSRAADVDIGLAEASGIGVFAPISERHVASKPA